MSDQRTEERREPADEPERGGRLAHDLDGMTR
jgi:hypothetical protein